MGRAGAAAEHKAAKQQQGGGGGPRLGSGEDFVDGAVVGGAAGEEIAVAQVGHEQGIAGAEKAVEMADVGLVVADEIPVSAGGQIVVDHRVLGIAGAGGGVWRAKGIE